MTVRPICCRSRSCSLVCACSAKPLGDRQCPVEHDAGVFGIIAPGTWPQKHAGERDHRGRRDRIRGPHAGLQSRLHDRMSPKAMTIMQLLATPVGAGDRFLEYRCCGTLRHSWARTPGHHPISRKWPRSPRCLARGFQRTAARRVDGADTGVDTRRCPHVLESRGNGGFPRRPRGPESHARPGLRHIRDVPGRRWLSGGGGRTDRQTYTFT